MSFCIICNFLLISYITLYSSYVGVETGRSSYLQYQTVLGAKDHMYKVL